MLRHLVLLVAVGLALRSGLALAGGGTVYTGGSPKATHQMQIYLLVQRNHGAKWDVDMETPCMGRAIGTSTGVYEPTLRLLHGTFKLHRIHTVQTSDTHYRYTLKGHRVRGGFAGTLTYVEIDGYYLPNPTTCASTLLHWTAYRGGIFR